MAKVINGHSKLESATAIVAIPLSPPLINRAVARIWTSRELSDIGIIVYCFVLSVVHFDVVVN